MTEMASVKRFPDSVVSKIDSSDIVCDECFSIYDEDRDDALNLDELSRLLEDLFHSKTHPFSDDIGQRIFDLLDEDKDGKLSHNDFRRCGYYWLKQTLKPVSALVVVDVQNDFIDGSLSLQQCPSQHNGVEVIPVINKLLESVPFDLIVYTKDWHPDNHISFVDNVKIRPMTKLSKVKPEEAKVYDKVEFDGPVVREQVLWPRHCVQHSKGAELHPDLKVHDNSVTVVKGTHSDVDSYSAFWDNNKQTQTDLVRILAKHRITDVHVCGVAYDVCVGHTALHSLEHGFRTIVIDDACRGVEVNGIEAMKKKLIDSGAIIVDSSKVKGIVTAEDRPSTLGLQTAKNVALARELVNRGVVN